MLLVIYCGPLHLTWVLFEDLWHCMNTNDWLPWPLYNIKVRSNLWNSDMGTSLLPVSEYMRASFTTKDLPVTEWYYIPQHFSEKLSPPRTYCFIVSTSSSQLELMYTVVLKSLHQRCSLHHSETPSVTKKLKRIQRVIGKDMRKSEPGECWLEQENRSVVMTLLAPWMS